jgi:DNA-binding MarR family transcriptional regulator
MPQAGTGRMRLLLYASQFCAELYGATVTRGTVPPHQLYGTTDGVAPDSPDDTEIARLLAQLLRVVGPIGDADGTSAREQGRRVERDGAGAPVVSSSEARALLELVAAHGIAQGELASLLGLEKSTVSRLAAGLERKGWIRRGRDEENQRYVRLYLTESGSEVAARVLRAWQTRQAKILGGLTADERAGLSAGLRGLVRGLSAEGLVAENGRE